MRIALITTSFLPHVGGAEFVVHHLARNWSRQGHEVCVFNAVTAEATHADGEYVVRKFKVLRGGYRFGHHRFPFASYGARQMARLLVDYRPDFISAHFGYPVALWLSRVRPVPRFLITCHGPALNESPSGPRRRFGIDRQIAEALNASAGAVALSSQVRGTLEGMGVVPGKIIDIPNGVETERFGRPVDFDLRGRFGMARDARVILSVGRESWAKDYETGIRAFVRAARGDPGVHYLILGKGVRKWERLKAELTGAANVVLCEGLHGDELIGAYQQADIFFLPSIKETFPLVVVEAMAAGLPEVVTDVSGSQDAIKDQENGLVVPPGNLEAAATALRRLLDDEGLGKRLGAANRARAARYDWGRISRMYLEHLPDERPPAPERVDAHARAAR